ncbi:MAG TPA: phosphatase PAP2 family protein [Edaphocola sp.]|nr:phosphatase PAP2 family protein [Edaphocola sp.]
MKVSNPLSPSTSFIFSIKAINIFLVCCLFLWIFEVILFFKLSEEQLFRLVNGNHNSFFDIFFYWISFIGTFSVIGSVLILLVLIKYKSWNIFGLFAFTQLIPFLINQGLKLYFAQPRPSIVFGGQPWFHAVEGVQLHTGLSFPSGHTAGAFAFFTLLSMLLPARQKLWAILFFILAVLVAYSRIYLGQHFFVDVFAGSMVGTVLPLIIFLIWEHFQKRKQNPK